MRAERTVNGRERETERQQRRQAGENLRSTRVAREAVRDNADAMSAGNLALHEIDDVAKQSAHRGA